MRGERMRASELVVIGSPAHLIVRSPVHLRTECAIMSHGFLPRTDAALLNWARNFSKRLLAEHESLGISLEQAEAFEQFTVDFAAKLQLCFPEIRNKVATSGKNVARGLLKANAKLLSLIIQGQANINDVQKIQLGLNVRKAPTARAAPSSPPLVLLSPGQGQNTVTVRLSQSGDDTGLRGRPRSAIGAMVFTFVGDEPPTGLSGWRFHALASSTSIDITFDAALAPGTKVWVTASWIGSRKQTGPLASAVSTHLLGGGVGAATTLRLAA